MNAVETVGFVDLKQNPETLQQKCGKIFEGEGFGDGKWLIFSEWKPVSQTHGRDARFTRRRDAWRYIGRNSDWVWEWLGDFGSCEIIRRDGCGE